MTETKEIPANPFSGKGSVRTFQAPFRSSAALHERNCLPEIEGEMNHRLAQLRKLSLLNSSTFHNALDLAGGLTAPLSGELPPKP